ncbi:hypothetical protein Tco_1465181 [Tanacetum coccineum]
MSRDPPLLEVNTSRRGEDNMEYHDDLTDFIPPTPHDSPLSGGNTPGSDEGRIEIIQELMEIYTSLTKRVIALEEAKTAQDRVIARLKLRVKRLEKKRKARTSQPMKRRLFKGRVETSTDKSLGEDASKQGSNDDKTEELNLTVEDKGSGEKGGSNVDQVSTARPEISVASVPVNVSVATPFTPPTTTTIFGDEDLTIAQTLMKMRSDKGKEKEKGVVLKDEEEPPRLNRSTTTLQPLPTIDPKYKELAQRLHEEELTEFDRAQKERQKQEEATSAALAEERKKQLAAERAEAIKNKPPTRTQVRNKMITYLKHMAESTKKRPRADFEKERSKKQKLEEDNDTEKEELKDSMDVVPRDDVAIDVESLATKYPIVDWKTHILNENMMYYQIIKADGSSKNYKIFSEMLNDFDRQDVIDLHRLVNERYEITSPEGYDLLLWGDLKTLFKPKEEDEIWKNQQDYNLIRWRLFDSCGVHTASTAIEPNKALVKDGEAEDVDVHLYRSMIGSLMYLTSSRPDITFAVCACARDSPFNLEAFSNSDYAGASLDKKSTIRGCQFLSKRLISWECKKQTIVANSTTEAEYVVAVNCYEQVLWIQNQMLDYGFNFMNTKIYINNESTICIVKNPVFHSKTKHIEIRHHFIRDSHEKKLIQVIKIHTDHNVADLLTKAFDVSKFNFLIASIGMLNL